MSGGSGFPEVVENEPKNVSNPECDRCGAAAVVTRGDAVLCGPCYYTETVRERRRPGVRVQPEPSPILEAIQQIERAVLEKLQRGSCKCSGGQ